MNTKEIVSCLQAMNLVKITPDNEAICYCPRTPAKTKALLSKICPPIPRKKQVLTEPYDMSAVRSLNATLNASVSK